jgi:hypothetical protein
LRRRLASKFTRRVFANCLSTLEAGLTPSERRELRGIEILEQIDSPEAREWIGRLALGDRAAVITEEAWKAKERTEPWRRNSSSAGASDGRKRSSVPTVSLSPASTRTPFVREMSK